MVRHRRSRDSIWRSQLSRLLAFLTFTSFFLLCLIRLVQHSDDSSPLHGRVFLQRDTTVAAALNQQEQKHRLAIGLTMHGSSADAQQRVGSSSTLDPNTRHSGVWQELQSMYKDLDVGNIDPEHLTDVQEKLLNAALARQAKSSVDREAQRRAKKRERQRARMETRVHMMEDLHKLRAFVSSPLYTAYQDTRRQKMQGRGILIAAGGPIQLASTYATLKTLRQHLKCDLPVELFFDGSREMDAATLQYFQAEFSNIKLIDGSAFPYPEHHRRVTLYEHAGWAFKAFALYSTSFEQVLYIDADCLPLVAPDYLFNSPGFREHGSLFWPDYWDTTWMNPAPAYRLMNATSPWLLHPHLLTTESGQFLLDRSRHMDALEWILYLNMCGDIIYSLVWGDKDLYRLAFTLAGQEDHFSQVVHRPADALAYSKNRKVPQIQKGYLKEERAFGHAAMIQLDTHGSMAFFHRTSDGKLDPEEIYAANRSAADWITVPLTPQRATAVLGGTLIVCPQGLSIKETANCTVGGRDLLQAVDECQLDINEENLPIPVWPLTAFPKVNATLAHSFQAFLQVQAEFQSNSSIRLGS